MGKPSLHVPRLIEGRYFVRKGYSPMKRLLPIGLALVLLFLWTGLTFAAPADEPTAQPTKLKHDGGINDLSLLDAPRSSEAETDLWQHLLGSRPR